jgi:GT2 family glycosyltransferase
MAGLDVWVVDNASSDGSAEMVRSRHPQVRLIASDRNLGFGAAVNLVAAETCTPWIAAANADVRLRESAVAHLIDKGSATPAAGLVVPRLVRPDGAAERSALAFPTLPFTVLFQLGLASADARLSGSPFARDCERIDWAHGAFMLIRRVAWDRVGGFDPEQWMYAEDLDLCWRLAQAGWECWIEPRAVVEHRGAAATSLAWGDGREERMMRSAYGWMLRRRGALTTRAVAAVNVAGACARAALSRSGWQRERYRRWARLHSVGLRPRAELERHR